MSTIEGTIRLAARLGRRRPHAVARPIAMAALAIGLLGVCGSLGGCVLGALAGSFYATGTHSVEAEYRGIDGKSYAVLVQSAPGVSSANPSLILQVQARTNQVISQQFPYSRRFPDEFLWGYMTERPQWRLRTASELMEELGVDRLILVEIAEYRLQEPGNQYIWDGMATAYVWVHEAESFAPDRPAFDKLVTVSYPDGTGVMTNEMSRTQVADQLTQRLVNRITWLFFDHEEPNLIEY